MAAQTGLPWQAQGCHRGQDIISCCLPEMPQGLHCIPAEILSEEHPQQGSLGWARQGCELGLGRGSVRQVQSWISLNYAGKAKRQMRENQQPGTLSEETDS